MPDADPSAGVRRTPLGEAAALRVYRVDLLRRRLEVDEAHTEVGGHVSSARQEPSPAFRADSAILADELANIWWARSQKILSSPHLPDACCETPTFGLGSSIQRLSGLAWRG